MSITRIAPDTGAMHATETLQQPAAAGSLSHEIDVLTERLHGLRSRAGARHAARIDLVEAALDELASAAAELHVLKAELHRQTAALLATRDELDEQRRRYQELFEHTPVAHLVTDCYGAIMEANAAAADFLAISPHFLIGKPLAMYVDAADRRRVRDELRALGNADQLQEWELTVVPRQGEALPAAVTIRAMRDQHGQPQAFHWLIRDLTDRRRAGQERLREEHLASVSHDLRTPLTTIKGFAQVLGRQLARGQPLEADDAERLGSIVEGANSMERMVASLLDLAHESTDAPLKLNRRSVDLVALVCRQVTIQQGADQTHTVKMLTAAPALVGEWDGERLERVIANLLSNAAKYSPAGAPITVSITCEGGQCADADGAQPRRWAVLAVRDQGIGILQADLPHVMERFHRGANVAATYPGTGLGLAGARHTVEQHGGSITIESREGSGTTVTIRLPLA